MYSGGIVLRGPALDPDLLCLQRFLVRNYYPHRTEEFPKDDDPGEDTVSSELPAVVLPDGRTLARPTIMDLADELGITEPPDPHSIYDVAVIGAGPSGLAAAV